MNPKVNTFIAGSKFKDLISINKQITIISIMIQTQAKFCLCFTVTVLALLYSTDVTVHIIEARWLRIINNETEAK